MFNPQDGKRLRERASGPTPATFRPADGATLEGQRLRFQGDAHIDDFHDAGGVWAGLSGKLGDGSALICHRL